MATTNYLKATTFGIHPETNRSVTVSKIFFFDDRDPGQVRAAYEAGMVEALKFSGKLSFYRLPKLVGPWAGIQEVGHGLGLDDLAPGTN